jgi:hypothetical protein
MAQEDLSNNRSVRQVLVRHWIDLGRLAIHSANGRVTVRGTVQLLRGVKHELDSQAMENIFREIKRVNTIKQLTFILDNWSLVNGVWQKTDHTTQDHKSLGDRPSTFEI